MQKAPAIFGPVHGGLLLAVLVGLWALAQVDFLFFHALAEMAGIAVATGLFLVAWNTRHFVVSGFFVAVGVTYLHVAAFDLVHTLTFRGMGLVNDGGNVAIQSWIAARLLEAAMLALSFAFLRWRIGAERLQLGLGITTALLFGSIFVVPVFPDCFIPGQGITGFKLAAEYVVILLFGVGAVLAVVTRGHFEPAVWACLALSFVLRMLSEFAFTSYADLADSTVMVGHLLKVAGLYLFYRATVTMLLTRPYQTMFQDIAAARDALRYTEERFRLSIRPAPVLVFSQDRNMRYDWVFSGDAIAGRVPAVGQTDADFLGEHDAATIGEIKLAVLESGKGMRRQIRLGRRRRRFFDLTVEPLRNDDGAVTGLIGTAIDVTDLMMARAEAERANQAKSRFLASASHDLRQPFQAMRLFHHMLASRMQDETGRAIATKLDEAMSAGEDLLRALLDVSTLEAGMLRPKISNFPVSDVLQHIATEFEPQAAAKGLRFRVVQSTAVVGSDPTLLARMVRNLVTNALRYTRRGGIVVGCRRDGDGLKVVVCDTGIGVPQDQLDIIFDDFYQIGNTERDREKGLGLGLPVVRRVAALLGHRISVRSVVGRGSCFAIRVPLIDVATSASPPMAADVIARQN